MKKLSALIASLLIALTVSTSAFALPDNESSSVPVQTEQSDKTSEVSEQKPEEKQERQEGQTEQSQPDDLKEAQATVDAIMEKYGYYRT